MSKIHNLVYDKQQRDLESETSKVPSKAQVLKERLEYLEWEISSLVKEHSATLEEYDKEEAR